MDNANDKKAGIIGKVMLILYIVSFVVLIAILAVFVLTLKACSDTFKKEPNTGKEPYTQDFIESYLETSYGTDFTFVRELETPEYSDNTAYVYTDANGLETNVVQHYEHGYMFNGHYEVEDNYAVVKMFADAKVLAALDSAGYEYSFDSGDYTAEKGVYVCVMNAPAYEDIAKVAEILYTVADDYFLEQPDSEKKYGAEFDKFLHRSPCFAVGSPDGYPLSYLNMSFTPKGQIPYQHESLQDFTAKCERQYTIWTEKGDIIGTVPDSAYDDLARYSYQVCYSGEPVQNVSFEIDAESGEYCAVQDNCFTNYYYTVNEFPPTLCPMVEELAEIAGLSAVETDNYELSFFRMDDDETHPYLRLYREHISHGKYGGLMLDMNGEPYEFSSGGKTIGNNAIQLSTDDIYRIFGIEVVFNNSDQSAELFLADPATEE